MIYTVYALVDPRTGVTFYVGCSTNPKDRLRRHRSPRLGDKARDGMQVKLRVAEMQSQGFQPSMVILEQTEDRTKERQWIERYKAMGLPLLNTCLPYAKKQPKLTPAQLSEVNRLAAIKRTAKQRAESLSRYEAYKRTQGR